MGCIGPRLGEVVVEDLTDDRAGFLGVGEESSPAPQAARAAEGRNAALYRDARAREGDETAGLPDQGSGGCDRKRSISLPVTAAYFGSHS